MVMDKTEQPRGLIRYGTDRAMHGGGPTRVLRPRVMIYTAALTLFICAVFGALLLRTPLKLDVIRDRGSMGREVEDGMIENVYRLQIMNTSEQAHSYRIRASGIDGLAVVTEDMATLGATETRAVPVRLRAPHGAGERGSNKITFELTATDDPSLAVRETAVFIVPRR
jgi:polyferredoxin